MAIAVIFAAGEGRRIASLTKGAPKALLEVDPDSATLLRRTIIGRLVGQFLSEPEIERVLIICKRPKPFREFIEKFPGLSRRVELCAVPLEATWREQLVALREAVGSKPFVAVAGDAVFRESTIRRAIAATNSKRQFTAFFSFVKNDPMYRRRFGTDIWASKGGLPEWVSGFTPGRWAELPKLLWQHRKEIGLRLAKSRLDITTPVDFKRAERLMKRKRFK